MNLFIYSQTVHLQSSTTCLNTTKTTTKIIDNDHPTWSVGVALLFRQHVTPRLAHISAFQSYYASTFYRLQGVHNLTGPHTVYRC